MSERTYGGMTKEALRAALSNRLNRIMERGEDGCVHALSDSLGRAWNVIRDLLTRIDELEAVGRTALPVVAMLGDHWESAVWLKNALRAAGFLEEEKT